MQQRLEKAECIRSPWGIFTAHHKPLAKKGAWRGGP